MNESLLPNDPILEPANPRRVQGIINALRAVEMAPDKEWKPNYSYIRETLEALSATVQSEGPTPGKNVLETVEQYRREHPGAIERAEAEMIAEEAGLYDYTCPHCFKVFRAIYGQDFPNCPYCTKQLTWWPTRPSGIQQALPDTHLLQRVKDVADGTINFGMGAALREIGKWILTGHHEPLTCANDGDYCEYSRTDCAADGSFNCQAHVREA